jgi:hypothetical protein
MGFLNELGEVFGNKQGGQAQVAGNRPCFRRCRDCWLAAVLMG